MRFWKSCVLHRILLLRCKQMTDEESAECCCAWVGCLRGAIRAALNFFTPLFSFKRKRGKETLGWVFEKVHDRCMRCRIRSGITAGRAWMIVNRFTVVDMGFWKSFKSSYDLNTDAAPKYAIIPMPISIADSSISKWGVCTPAVMPLEEFAVPRRKKQPGIFCE